MAEDIEEPKPVWSSASEVRFYMRDGWTEFDLRSVLSDGEVQIANPKDPSDMQFYRFKPGSVININAMVDNISVAHRHLDGLPHNVEELLKHFYG